MNDNQRSGQGSFMIWFPQSMLQSANPILFHEFVDERSQSSNELLDKYTKLKSPQQRHNLRIKDISELDFSIIPKKELALPFHSHPHSTQSHRDEGTRIALTGIAP
ncbi:hypothetical protein JHK84_047796 [Glycine max]|uniref:Uncharacterized protein n=2 Tax=Glycine subgen. Soja TaxID=1462606 RepID=K7MM88_SOYBN|nr:hypothetical protein JHK86_047775 [Glycine max]RZB57377.1 hypothetical protein D0Y65_046165 [Glycine soja]KAG4943747.1 hypothetical protein JHK85_048393 [Glycine max]KAG5102827.1 hypothetical protein JHK84_047796 [Glycine max]KAH1118929.1 hypothetical protein GYH30_047639 [Glycine max]